MRPFDAIFGRLATHSQLRMMERLKGKALERLAPRDASLRVSASFCVMTLFLISVFLMGGGARANIESLILLRPLAVLVLGYGLWGLSRAQVESFSFLFAISAVVLGLVLVQLIPLPPIIWMKIPGHELVAEIDRTAGLGAQWRPLSLVPTGGWNAFYALLVPLAVLVLCARLTQAERRLLLPLLIAIGLVSALLGIVQILSSDESNAYFYRVTNPGTAVGLFANHNHQAVFLACLYPMLAVYASSSGRRNGFDHVRKMFAIACGFVVLPLIMITESRAGFVAVGLGLLSVYLLYHETRQKLGSSRFSNRPRYKWQHPTIYGAVALFFLVLLTLATGHGDIFSRFAGQSLKGDFRFQAWGPILSMAEHYFPFGSGYGSFAEVYQIDEPTNLLSSDYFNHAHNDWLEVFMTGGLPALIVLMVVVWAVFQRARVLIGARRIYGKDQKFPLLGLVLILILSVASTVDYPLRVPSMACLFAIAAVWLSEEKQ